MQSTSLVQPININHQQTVTIITNTTSMTTSSLPKPMLVTPLSFPLNNDMQPSLSSPSSSTIVAPHNAQAPVLMSSNSISLGTTFMSNSRPHRHTLEPDELHSLNPRRATNSQNLLPLQPLHTPPSAHHKPMQLSHSVITISHNASVLDTNNGLDNNAVVSLQN